MTKQFGGRVTKALLEKYSKSINWKDGKFQNLEETIMALGIQHIPKLLYKQICKPAGRMPASPIAILPFDKDTFLAPAANTKFIWYGHSVILLRINNKTLLIDPMLGSDASPIAPFATKRFSENTLAIIDALPEIDLLLLSHDHYDHLDYDSISRLQKKVKQYFVALGVARHLTRWKVPEENITEFDWWDKKIFENIHIHFTPTRHFSGRGVADRAKSLWGGWVFKTANESLYFSGDGGYGNHFKEVGKRLGPFDFGWMECGQYHELWRAIHMFPEEAIKAATDAGVKKIMPVHWAGFALAQHHWKEPIEKFTEYAMNANIPCISPAPGKICYYEIMDENSWWKALN